MTFLLNARVLTVKMPKKKRIRNWSHKKKRSTRQVLRASLTDETVRIPEKDETSLRPFLAFQKQHSSESILPPSSSQIIYITPRKSDEGNTVSSCSTSTKSVSVASCGCFSSVGNTATISKGSLTSSRSLLIPRETDDNFTSPTTTTTTNTNIVFLSQQSIDNSSAIVPSNQQLKGNVTQTTHSKQDNLSRTIDYVATHYSKQDNLSRTIDYVATHYDEAVPIPEKKKTTLRPFEAFQKQSSSNSILPPSSSQIIYITPRKSDGGNTVSSNSTSTKSVSVASCDCFSSVGNTATTSKGSLTPSRSLLTPRATDDNFTSTATTTTTTTNIVFLSQQSIANSLVIVPPNQQLNCGGKVAATAPMLTVVQPINSSVNPSNTSSSSHCNTCVTTTSNTILSLRANVNVHDSQNYILPSGVAASNSNMVVPVVLNDPNATQPLNSLPSLAPLSSNYSYTISQKRGEVVSSATKPTIATTTANIMSNSVDTVAFANKNGVSSSGERGTEEWDVLNGIFPENLSQAVTDLVLKLKPRHPGPLSVTFDESMPSTAGPVTANVNSISNRNFRDFGTVEAPESEILKLRLENEELRRRHAEEIVEIKKNIITILKDIQKNIVEERAKIVEEARAACEVETIKRIEEAKSKQWCANCFKESQFYCCWNTSYCDYPCQQKHWLKHMSKCTQNQLQQLSQQSGNNTNQIRIPNQANIVRPTNPANRHPESVTPNEVNKTLVAKPMTVYAKRGNIEPSPDAVIKCTTAEGQQLTLVELSPGDYELLG